MPVLPVGENDRLVGTAQTARFTCKRGVRAAMAGGEALAGDAQVAGVCRMPEKRTIEKARKAKRAGKAASTHAGEFVREEVNKDTPNYS